MLAKITLPDPILRARIEAGLKKMQAKAPTYQCSVEYQFLDDTHIIYEIHLLSETMPLFGKMAGSILFKGLKDELHRVSKDILITQDK